MAEQIVGPVPVSTHDSELDKTRPDDYATLTADVPGATRAARTVAAQLTPAEKAAIRNAQVDAIFGEQLAGSATGDQIEAGVRGRIAAEGNLQQEVPAFLAASPAPTTTLGRFDSALATQQRQEIEGAVKQTTSFLDITVAAFTETTALPALVRTMMDPEDNAPDANFDYMSIRDVTEAQFPAEEDKQYLRESRSGIELERRVTELQRKQEAYKTMGQHGAGLAVAGGLAGGFVDPVGWVAGFGVGKVAQLTASGVRAARVADGLGDAKAAVSVAGDPWVQGVADDGWGASVAFSNGVKETVKYGAYGATGNLLTDAAYDAAGGHVTYNDYLASAAFGVAFGQLARLGNKTDPELNAAANVLDEQAADLNAMLYAKAQQRAGAEATPEQIKAEVDAIVGEEVLNTRAVLLADVDDGQKILPIGAEPTNQNLESILLPPVERQEALVRAGITPELVADDGERLLLGELFARAQRWEAANPIDEQRVSIMAKVPWLRTTGLGLATSNHPVGKWVSGVLLENTTGVAGRRRTAAMTKSMQERIYLGDLAEFNTQYEAWRGRNGGGVIGDVVLGSQHRNQFNKMVYREIEARRVGGAQTNNPHVKGAADAVETGFNRMRLDAQKAGVPGADRFKDTSVGYIPRRISQQWIMSSTVGQREAVSDALAKQLAEGDGWDLPFAKRIATQYIERGRTEAYGGETLPANLHSPEAAGMLADLMRKEGIPEEDVARLLGRFSRGGSSYTKKRLDLDLSENVALADGSLFSLMDAFDTDVGKLYHSYARRMSGEVALSRFGVPGEQGLKMLRKALEYGGPDGQGVGVENMRHFDQIAAEFMGRPLPGTGNKHLGNLRLLTASSRLGGMVFTQFAESANAVGALGVKGAMDQIKSIPRMISEVRSGKSNAILDSMEVVAGPIGKDHQVVVPFQEPGDIKVYGQDSLNAFDRIVRAGSNALPWVSGWHYMHSAQVRGMTEQIAMKAMRFIREGKDDVALEQMGIDASLRQRLTAELGRIATFDERGTLSALNLQAARDAGAVADFVQAVTRGAGQIIQKTYIGETGKWAHDDLLRLLVQFRSFSLVAMEKQWTRQRVDFGTAKAFGLLMGSMAFALPIHLARVQINSIGREDREEYVDRQTNPMALARATLNYASLSGLAGDILDSGAALGGYSVSGVRTGQTNALGQVPALGYVNDVFQAATEKSPNDAVRLLPGGNLPWLMPVLNVTKDDGQ